VGLHTELFHAIIPTLFPYILLICYLLAIEWQSVLYGLYSTKPKEHIPEDEPYCMRLACYFHSIS